jgi:hypothetical protein
MYRQHYSAGEMDAVVATVRDAAQVAFDLRWTLTEGAAVRVDKRDRASLVRFRDGQFEVQEVLRATRLDEVSLGDGWGWFPDATISKLLDPTEPFQYEAILDRLLKCQVVVSHHDLPSWIIGRLQTIRRCYALCLYDAAFVFMRSVIEAASYDWLAEHQGPSGATDIANRQPLGTWLDRVLQGADLSARHRRDIRGIVERANELIHSKRNVREPNDAEALRALGIVVHYVERLFA